MYLPFARQGHEDRPVLIMPVPVRHPCIEKETPRENVESRALEWQLTVRRGQRSVKDIPYVLQRVTRAPYLVSRHVTRNSLRPHVLLAVVQRVRIRAQVRRDRT